MVREYCQKNFVGKGMCCDFAIHDPGPPGHNPHAHVMLTVRSIDEQGKWMPKCKKIYDLDQNGERIRLPFRRWKSHNENLNDWNDKGLNYGEKAGKLFRTDTLNGMIAQKE